MTASQTGAWEVAPQGALPLCHSPGICHATTATKDFSLLQHLPIRSFAFAFIHGNACRQGITTGRPAIGLLAGWLSRLAEDGPESARKGLRLTRIRPGLNRYESAGHVGLLADWPPKVVLFLLADSDSASLQSARVLREVRGLLRPQNEREP